MNANMHSLRILHVTPYAGDAWAYGGIPRVVSALAAAQTRLGHQVTVCTTDACSAEARLNPAEGSADVHLFPNLSNRAAYHWQLFLPRGMNRYLREHAHDFDIAHLHACRNAPGVLAARHLQRAGVPFVLMPNGTAPRIERRFLAKRVFDRVWGTRVLRQAARIIVVSEAERRQVLALGVETERIAMVPNPVALDEFEDPGPASFRSGSDKAPIVLFLGKLTPRKRVDVLVEAFARLDQAGARLVIAGNDMGAGPGLRRQVARLGLTNRVRFAGLLVGRDRLDAMRVADVVVYPSAHEIFGLVPMEALLCHTPVVVADDSGCGEIISRIGGGQVVRLGDATALAAAIASVLDAPDAGRTEVRKAATRIREEFNGDRVARRLDAVYRAATALRTACKAAVSFVVPVHNGAAWIAEVLAAIIEQTGSRPAEILVVDDRSEDDSAAIVLAMAATAPIPIRLLDGHGRGAAAAINTGVRAARHPLIGQVDQDVVVGEGWLDRLASELDDPSVGAAQGHYTTPAGAGVFARVMGLDLSQRYAAIRGRDTDHVCTGNAMYRREALEAVGLFDEQLGYGYDNDMSYRLHAAGYRLRFRRDARSTHRWREGLAGYWRQQFGFGYGRLQLIAKHPRRAAGDRVSPSLMMLHPVTVLAALVLAILGGVLAFTGGPWALTLAVAGGMMIVLFLERALAGTRATLRFGDRSGLWFPVVHLVRDCAWVVAVVGWSIRRLLRREQKTTDSMRPGARRSSTLGRLRPPAPSRLLGLIPAHNEAAALPFVVNELRAACPHIDLLVVDDGSTDGTAGVIARLDVRWIRLPRRMGVGSAMRAGLKLARRLGYDAVVRIDGDGQHRAIDVDKVLAPLRARDADVVLGSRLPRPESHSRPGVGPLLRFLGVCLAWRTGERVTDPTTGFCAFGPRALEVLADHHPTGYPEPELRLFASHNRLRTVEVPVVERPRQGGRSSLTLARVCTAGARVLLAMIVVPLRRTVADADHD